MTLLGLVLRWTGIITGLAVLSLAGFFLAVRLSPGDPGRSYAYATLGLAVLTLLWRLFAPRYGR